MKQQFGQSAPIHGAPRQKDLPDLDRHLAMDQGFMSAYARTLAAIATIDGSVSFAEFAALADIAWSSDFTALVGTQIFHAIEQKVSLKASLVTLETGIDSIPGLDRSVALELAYPLLHCAGHRARPIARRLAQALAVQIPQADLGELPPEDDQGLLGRFHEGVRGMIRPQDEADRIVKFGRYIGEPLLICTVRDYRNGSLSRSDLVAELTSAIVNTERSIAEYEKSALLARAATATTASLMATATALKQQIEQRLVNVDARIRFERETFSQDIEDLVHDAGNGLEVAIADRLSSSNWRDKDVWTSIARTQFGQEAERRIERAVRRQENSLLLLKEELRLFRNELRLARASILDCQHHTAMARLMPRLRLRARIVNAVDAAAGLTLKAGAVAVAATGAAAYFLGASAVLSFVAPTAPAIGGAMAVAGLFKLLTDSEKRKLAEIRYKRKAIEGLVRSRLEEAFFVLLQPVGPTPGGFRAVSGRAAATRHAQRAGGPPAPRTSEDPGRPGDRAIAQDDSPGPAGVAKSGESRMTRMITSNGSPSTRLSPCGTGLAALAATAFIAVWIFLWLVGANPHLTPDASARDAAEIRAASAQHVLHAEQRARAAIARRADELAAYVQSCKAGARPFAKDMVSLYGKWRVVQAWLPFTDPDGHKRYVEEKFAQHVFSTAQLTAAITRSAADLSHDFEGIENELAVQLRQELLGRSLEPSEIPAATAGFHSTVRQLTDVAQREAAKSTGALAVSEAASQIGSQVLVRFGVSTGVLAAGAANAWWSLGAGLVVGFAVDAAWDQITDPSGEIETKTMQGLHEMSLKARQVTHEEMLLDLSRRSVLWKKSIEEIDG